MVLLFHPYLSFGRFQNPPHKKMDRRDLTCRQPISGQEIIMVNLKSYMQIHKETRAEELGEIEVEEEIGHIQEGSEVNNTEINGTKPRIGTQITGHP